MHKRALLFAGVLTAVLCCGCSSKTVDSGNTGNTDSTAASPTEAETMSDAKKGTMHIAVEHCTVSEAELKELDYTVPLAVTLEKNGGISYTEWGVSVDSRCTFTADSQNRELVYHVYEYINEEANFLWCAWAAGNKTESETGDILYLNIKLPKDAKAGETYTVDYAAMSMAEKPHVWKGENDWVALDDVTWEDGGITVSG